MKDLRRGAQRDTDLAERGDGHSRRCARAEERAQLDHLFERCFRPFELAGPFL